MKKGYTTETDIIGNSKYILVCNYENLNEIINWHRSNKPKKQGYSIGFWHVKLKQ